jgi:uncharacterized protein (UPF0335 family)
VPVAPIRLTPADLLRNILERIEAVEAEVQGMREIVQEMSGIAREMATDSHKISRSFGLIPRRQTSHQRPVDTSIAGARFVRSRAPFTPYDQY